MFKLLFLNNRLIINKNKITHYKLIYLNNYLLNLHNIHNIHKILKRKSVGIVEILYNNSQVNNKLVINHHPVINHYQTNNNNNQIVQKLHLKIRVLNRYKVYASIK